MPYFSPVRKPGYIIRSSSIGSTLSSFLSSQSLSSLLSLLLSLPLSPPTLYPLILLVRLGHSSSFASSIYFSFFFYFFFSFSSSSSLFLLSSSSSSVGLYFGYLRNSDIVLPLLSLLSSSLSPLSLSLPSVLHQVANAGTSSSLLDTPLSVKDCTSLCVLLILLLFYSIPIYGFFEFFVLLWGFFVFVGFSLWFLGFPGLLGLLVLFSKGPLLNLLVLVRCCFHNSVVLFSRTYRSRTIYYFHFHIFTESLKMHIKISTSKSSHLKLQPLLFTTLNFRL